MTTNLIFLIGVSSSRKTTIASLTSEKTGLPFFDGDNFHPLANIAKMKSGSPLNDSDRKTWLEEINKLAQNKLENGTSVLIASSALKKEYRRILGRGVEEQIKWVFLNGDFGTIPARLNDREEHFMPPSLLQSQFDTLKPPEIIANQIIKELKL